MSFSYTQVDAITHDLILKKLTEGVFTDNSYMERMIMNRETEDGGNKIIAPLYVVDSTGTTGEFYSPRDTLSLQEYDGISASEHEWRYIHESVVIYKSDIGKNQGRLGVLKLVDKKVNQARLAMMERMTKGSLSDGTVSTGALDDDQFDGLELIIASSGAYGGITPGDLSTWVSYVDDNSGTNRTLTQAIVDKAFDQTEGRATLGLSDKSVFTKIKGLLTGIQRTTRENTLDGLGHKGIALVYNGIDHLIENQMSGNRLFYISEEFFKLHVMNGHFMRVERHSSLETADALLERIFLYGNVVAQERKYHSRVNDISV